MSKSAESEFESKLLNANAYQVEMTAKAASLAFINTQMLIHLAQLQVQNNWLMANFLESYMTNNKDSLKKAPNFGAAWFGNDEYISAIAKSMDATRTAKKSLDDFGALAQKQVAEK